MVSADPRPAQVDAALRFAVQQARELLHVRRVWLFGSRAAGTAHRTSDIDLAFEFDVDHRASWGRFVATIDEEAPTLLSFDLVDVSTCGADLRQQILSKGEIIYDADCTP